MRPQILFLALAALVGISGCGALSQSDSQTIVFQVGSAPQVHVTGVSGDLRVTAGHDGEVRILASREGRGSSGDSAEAAMKSAQITATREGDDVEVRVQLSPTGGDVSVAFELQVPDHARLDLQTTSGDIRVSGPIATLRAVTTSGTIEAQGIEVSADARNTSGDISLEASGAARVTALTTSGDVRYAGPLGSGTSRLETTSGDVGASLPDDASFQLEARTANGEVTVDFPITPRAGATETAISGTVGRAPGATLELKSTNGDVAVHRQG